MDKDLQLSPHFKLGELFARIKNGQRIFDQESWDYLGKQTKGYQDEIVRNLTKLAHSLEPIRVKLNRPIHPNRGYSCPSANKAAGGVDNSLHKKGKAVDFDATQAEQKKAGLSAWPGGYGKASTWCHLDNGPHDRWNYS